MHLHSGGLLAAAPCSYATLEVERLAVPRPWPVRRRRDGVGCTLCGDLHVKVCVPGLIFHREGDFPRERRHELGERASRSGQVHMPIDTARSLVFQTKGIEDLLHIDMGNLGAHGEVRQRLARSSTSIRARVVPPAR